MILYKSILYTPAKFKPFDLFVFIDKDRLREVFFPHFFINSKLYSIVWKSLISQRKGHYNGTY